MTDTLRVAGLQMPVLRDVAHNEEKIRAGIEGAAHDRAHFLLTPEGSLSGYRADFDRAEVAAALERVTAFAAEMKVGLLLGTCYEEMKEGRPACFNQVRVYSPEGDYLGFHAKILRCTSLESPGSGEMAQFAQSTLRTFEWHGIRFGALICNDMWATPGYTVMPNPYLPWKLKQMGAKVIFHAINSGVDQRTRPFHESTVELWARKLGIYIVEVNATPEDGKAVNACSGLVGPDGSKLLVAPDSGEQDFCGDITH